MSHQSPGWVTEEVVIAPWDPGWEARAGALVRALEPVLAGWLVGPVEHVGSTAVPALPAKPIVDLAAPLAALRAAEEADPALAAAGWHLLPPDPDRGGWRRTYVLPDGGRRVAHLHLVRLASPTWRDMLVFRDALRGRPDVAAAYARVKQAAARAHRADRAAYTAAKADFVQRTVRDELRRGADTGSRAQ